MLRTRHAGVRNKKSHEKQRVWDRAGNHVHRFQMCLELTYVWFDGLQKLKSRHKIMQVAQVPCI